MSRWDDIKKKKSNTAESTDDESNLSRWDKIKKKSNYTPTDHSDFDQFVTDYENMAKSGYDEKTASDLKSRLSDLRVNYNLNRQNLSEEEKELDSYLNKVKYSIIEGEYKPTEEGKQG
jgi:hypothetical protein